MFRPFKPIRIFRFWQPFRDAKHGKPQKVERLNENSSPPLGGRAEALRYRSGAITVQLKPDPTYLSQRAHDEIGRSLKQILLTS